MTRCMRKQLALQVILGIAIAGMLFSGYLSYSELVRSTCALGGGCPSVATVPACVYGFVMYTALLVIAILGLVSKK